MSTPSVRFSWDMARIPYILLSCKKKLQCEYIVALSPAVAARACMAYTYILLYQDTFTQKHSRIIRVILENMGSFKVTQSRAIAWRNLREVRVA